MAVTDSLIAYLHDQFDAAGSFTVRRMFGGAGLFAGEAMFGLVAGDAVYLRLNDADKSELAAVGSHPFTYETRSGSRVMQAYWRLPEALLEDSEQAAEWAARAIRPVRAPQSAVPVRNRRKRADPPET